MLRKSAGQRMSRVDLPVLSSFRLQYWRATYSYPVFVYPIIVWDVYADLLPGQDPPQVSKQNPFRGAKTAPSDASGFLSKGSLPCRNRYLSLDHQCYPRIPQVPHQVPQRLDTCPKAWCQPLRSAPIWSSKLLESLMDDPILLGQSQLENVKIQQKISSLLMRIEPAILIPPATRPIDLGWYQSEMMNR